VVVPKAARSRRPSDLAYEFSNSEVRFDLKNGGREAATPVSVLRVWKKEARQ
jgi:hypothetical protein